MHTIETRYPDGTRARYKLQDGSSVPLQLSSLKRYRLKRLGEKRKFPRADPTTSTAEYVRKYFALNTESRHGSPCAYGQHIDHTKLYEPLNEARAAWPMGVDTVETVGEGEG